MFFSDINLFTSTCICSFQILTSSRVREYVLFRYLPLHEYENTFFSDINLFTSTSTSIFQCCKPLRFHTMKYQRFTRSGCKDIEILSFWRKLSFFLRKIAEFKKNLALPSFHWMLLEIMLPVTLIHKKRADSYLRYLIFLCLLDNRCVKQDWSFYLSCL